MSKAPVFPCDSLANKRNRNRIRNQKRNQKRKRSQKNPAKKKTNPQIVGP